MRMVLNKRPCKIKLHALKEKFASMEFKNSKRKIAKDLLFNFKPKC